MKGWIMLLQETGLPAIRWHDLRSIYCTLLLKNNFSPKAVAKLMGDARELITMDVYGDNGNIIAEEIPPELLSYMEEVLPEKKKDNIRHRKVQRHIFGITVQTEMSGRFSGNRHILTGNIVDFVFGETFCHIVIFQGGPFQVYFRTWINHFCTKGEGIDVGSHTENWIVGNITDLTVFGHCTCDSSHQKFCFIHTCIVGTDITMGSVQRTVQDLHFRVLDGCLQAGFQKRRGSGKDQVVAVGDGFCKQIVSIFFGGVIVAGCGYLILKGLLQMHTAKFMCISPAGYFGVFLVDESHKKFWGGARQAVTLSSKNAFTSAGVPGPVPQRRKEKR